MSTWESRMAARTKLRAKEQAITEEAPQEPIHTSQPWMNGWPRISVNSMLIGTGVNCVCCGHCMGVTCVAFTEDWVSPSLDPVWPFDEDDCPLGPHGVRSR